MIVFANMKKTEKYDREKNKDKYIQLCNQFKGILDGEELTYLKDEYEEDEIIL